MMQLQIFFRLHLQYRESVKSMYRAIDVKRNPVHAICYSRKSLT